MIAQLKAEFKKLLTVRSTYILTIVFIFLTALFTYLGTSRVFEEPAQPVMQESTTLSEQPPPEQSDKRQEQAEPPAPKLTNNLPNNKLLMSFQDNIIPVALFMSIVVILLMAHEFRYNTIFYTLTASNSRSKVLLAKNLVVVTYTTVFTLVTVGVVMAATYLAVNIKDLNLPPQDIEWWYTLARLLAYSLGFSLLGLAIITLVRNLTAAIVAIFFLPSVDAIISGLLASRQIEPTKWLPFSALGRVNNVISDTLAPSGALTSVTHAALVFAVYLVVVWVTAWYLFLRRDAS